MSLLFQLVATFLIISIPNVCFLYICIYGLSISDVFKGRGTRQLPRPYLVRAPLEEFHVQIFYVLVTPKQIIFKCSAFKGTPIINCNVLVLCFQNDPQQVL